MVKLKYIGAMAKGLAVCPGYKLNVERNNIYDVPFKVAKYFLVTKNWEKAYPTKEKPKKKEVEEVEKSYNKYEEEVD